MQTLLWFDRDRVRLVAPFRVQLLKWVGSKQRFAHEIASYFPPDIRTYIEPFLGSGAVLGTLGHHAALGSDAFDPLMQIWRMLKNAPETLKTWYADRWGMVQSTGKEKAYAAIRDAFNAKPNGADLLFLCRACYGGVVRFRQADGFMSTPCGVHTPIHPAAFARRVDHWRTRVAGTTFATLDYREAMESAHSGDLVYCDPPYSFSQPILYGAQSFDISDLFLAIDRCKSRDVRVALSIDGTKRSGNLICDVPIPDGLFEREVLVNCGRSMLKRFQMNGQSLEGEVVADRLLLTY